MVQTRASEATSSSTRLRHCRTHDPLQDTQGTEFDPEVVMEDVGTDDTAGSMSDSKGPIKEAYSATDEEDDNLIYNQERYRRNKAWRHYDFYYWDRRVIVERGVVMLDFDECAPKV